MDVTGLPRAISHRVRILYDPLEYNSLGAENNTIQENEQTIERENCERFRERAKISEEFDSSKLKKRSNTHLGSLEIGFRITMLDLFQFFYL